jgi:manganese transport protein
LSFQLSFAVVPLVMFTSDKLQMGEFVNSNLVKISSWVVAVIIIGLNVYLLWKTFF